MVIKKKEDSIYIYIINKQNSIMFDVSTTQ